MNERVSYEPPADVQKTGVEDAASRPRFRTFSAGALNFHSERHEPAGEKLCTDRNVAGTVVQSELINEYYAKSICKKIKSTFKTKGESGKHVASSPPYGYLK